MKIVQGGANCKGVLGSTDLGTLLPSLRFYDNSMVVQSEPQRYAFNLSLPQDGEGFVSCTLERMLGASLEKSRSHTSRPVPISILPSGLSPHYDQSARSDCEDGHQRTESRKTETQQRYQPRQDEPDTCQEHAEILVQLHGKTPFCERVRVFVRLHG